MLGRGWHGFLEALPSLMVVAMSRRSLLATALVPLLSLALVPACSSNDAEPNDSGDGERAECYRGRHEPEPEVPIHTPRWAFEPWYSQDYSTAEETLNIVDTSLEYGIPVGVVVLDSPWETNYNTFEFDQNPGRYPNPEAFIQKLGDKGVRVVVWMTQFINSTSFDLEKRSTIQYESPSPGYDLALSCGFFVDDGEEWSWWKGRGASIDFFNPSAVAFWHSLQDKVLDLGVAGFKLDFGDSYIRRDTIKTYKGEVSHQEYSEAYYADFYRHGVHKRGRDFVTMVRGWDESYDFEGRFFARPEHAPVVWAGDNRRDWVGLVDALDTIFRSVAAGYVVVGSDIGGYLDRDDKNMLGPQIPFDSLVFARWTAVSALMPFMQLHGRDDLMPWTVPENTEESLLMYRYWANLHHGLVPFLYSLAEETYAKRAPGIMRLVGNDPSEWNGDFRYWLGDAFFVAPIVDDSNARDIALPEGHRFYDWWTPEADAIEGGSVLGNYEVPFERIPVFVREGAIIPFNLDSDVVFAHGSLAKDKLTVLVWPSEDKSSFTLHDEDDETTKIEAQAQNETTTVSLSRTLRATVFRIRTAKAPTSVEVNGNAVEASASLETLLGGEGGYFYEESTRMTWVVVEAKGGETTVSIE